MSVVWGDRTKNKWGGMVWSMPYWKAGALNRSTPHCNILLQPPSPPFYAKSQKWNGIFILLPDYKMLDMPALGTTKCSGQRLVLNHGIIENKLNYLNVLVLLIATLPFVCVRTVHHSLWGFPGLCMKQNYLRASTCLHDTSTWRFLITNTLCIIN